MRVILMLLMTICVLPSCLPKKIPIYYQKQEVIFKGMRYKIYNSYWSDYIGKQYPGLFKKASAKFLIIDFSVMNTEKKVRELHFAPVFSLIDEQENEYEPGKQYVLMDNLAFKLLTEPMNPNVEIKGKLIFDVPPNRKYRLRVLSPIHARVSFAGSIKVTGEYFYFDLSPSREPPSRVGRIGANINKDGEIVAVINGTPAFQSGLKVGDKVIKIDGKPVVVGDAYKIVGKVTGEPGTTVELIVLRHGKELVFKIQRKILGME